MATNYISYYGETQDASTSISTSNVSNGSAGRISWVGTSCTWSSNRVNIDAGGSIKFTAAENFKITKVVIVSGSSNTYYGTWTATSGDVASSSGTTTVSDIDAQEVTVTTSTAFRCTNASSIKIYYTDAAAQTIVANPQFSLAAGAYEGTQNVTITCATDDATIYYTTDGFTPTETSSVYSAPIAVTESMTLKAFAAKDGLDDSEVVSAAYTILAAADVVLDFTDNTGWEIPVGNTKTEGEHTYASGDYSVTLFGPTGNGFYYDDAASNVLLGKLGAWMQLPAFAGHAIARITNVGVGDGGSANVGVNVFEGETAVSTAVTGCKADQVFEISPKKANVAYTLKVTNANNLRISKIKIWFGEPDPTTAIDNAAVEGKAVKFIENGQLFIEKAGVRYNVMGQIIK